MGWRIALVFVAGIVRLSLLAPVEAARPIFWKWIVAAVLRHLVQQSLEEQRRFQNAEATTLLGKHVLQEVVNVADGHAHQIHPNGVAQYHGEAEQRPRQIRGQEIEDAEKVHAYEGVTPRPHVHQHDGERLAQEQQVHEKRKANHERAAEYEHHDKVGALAAERALLQHAAVPVGERHVEEEIEADGAEEEEGGDEPPYLVVEHDQRRIEVQLERRDKVQVDG